MADFELAVGIGFVYFKKNTDLCTPFLAGVPQRGRCTPRN